MPNVGLSRRIRKGFKLLEKEHCGEKGGKTNVGVLPDQGPESGLGGDGDRLHTTSFVQRRTPISEEGNRKS